MAINLKCKNCGNEIDTSIVKQPNIDQGGGTITAYIECSACNSTNVVEYGTPYIISAYSDNE